ncbi:hypothetical protein H9P43_007486 [Blastocladiella emersonii ATCC 22665]|nr:hypothetical protein H9P43_007486 [Blastocladiella emersonii ATCC 22665]
MTASDAIWGCAKFAGERVGGFVAAKVIPAPVTAALAELHSLIPGSDADTGPAAASLASLLAMTAAGTDAATTPDDAARAVQEHWRDAMGRRLEHHAAGRASEHSAAAAAIQGLIAAVATAGEQPVDDRDDALASALDALQLHLDAATATATAAGVTPAPGENAAASDSANGSSSSLLDTAAAAPPSPTKKPQQSHGSPFGVTLRRVARTLSPEKKKSPRPAPNAMDTPTTPATAANPAAPVLELFEAHRLLTDARDAMARLLAERSRPTTTVTPVATAAADPASPATATASTSPRRAFFNALRRPTPPASASAIIDPAAPLALHPLDARDWSEIEFLRDAVDAAIASLRGLSRSTASSLRRRNSGSSGGILGRGKSPVARPGSAPPSPAEQQPTAATGSDATATANDESAAAAVRLAHRLHARCRILSLAATLGWPATLALTRNGVGAGAPTASAVVPTATN